MARKKKNQSDMDSNIPENDDLPEEEMEESFEEEDGEERGLDELFGNSTPGSAHRDLDGWGSEDYES
ncbi:MULTISPECIES: hypothetical protein [unclassified Fibrobacter]|uniref:hypothetical protein n=1 Tax=unclassified Fibrobacter TaxID=2634177 RepID=UPI000D6D14E2|nr:MULTISPECIES: hypothetical protein [unclassified Fibrobacter]PWJ60790.1 hypothetical protein BGX12_13510 [Fibrobacter sp. UWR4]PZW64651.1 hypothetical protein C8E88_103710 [Fibrobacter sp. UWR1]